ncbi:MAG: hypothetical protein E7620_03035 [Ruminococcaceae bacterium]|nr:hypothetical protein [Oscillospiraceae bacterium]
MGFGYLLIGYLIAFLLKLLASGLGIGGFALLLGYGMMCWGLTRLKLFCRSFAFGEWSLYPLLLIALYRCATDLATVFLWDHPIFTGAFATVVMWVELIFIVIFHAAVLSAIRELAMQLELKHIAGAAIRNTVIVALYAVLYLIYALPVGLSETVKPYLGLSLTVLNLLWLILNLLLFLACAKDICAEGDEEIEPKRYRWEFLNRVGDRFSENLKKAEETNKEEIEGFLRRRNEKRMKQAQDRDAARKQPIYHKKKKKKKK